jgi:hypothetical protein
MAQLQLLTGPQDPSQIQATLNTLISTLNSSAGVAGHDTLGGSSAATAQGPLAADLVYIKAAATPANGPITIAHQPDFARKFQIRIVIGTTTTTAITGGTLTLVGVNQSGQAVSEVISLIANASVTLQSTNCYAHLTSGTVAAYAANGSGTGNTLGLGQSAYLGLTVPPGFTNLTVNKESAIYADEAVGTVDYVSGSISPTTAPNGTTCYDFWWSCNTQE